MKLLNIKYKMHRLVNLVFYLIVFILGFILGFGAKKININNIISNFLFIDNVYAEELICRESENYFKLEDLVLDTSSGAPANVEISETEENTFIVSGNKAWLFHNYSVTLEPGVYTFSIDSTYGQVTDIEVRKGENLSWFFSFSSTNPKEVEILETTKVQLRFYNSLDTSNKSYSTVFYNVKITTQICEEEKEEVFVDIVNDNFYSFSKKLIGDVGEENYYIYDFIMLGVISICFIFMVLIIGYIIKKIFGG